MRSVTFTGPTGDITFPYCGNYYRVDVRNDVRNAIIYRFMLPRSAITQCVSYSAYPIVANGKEGPKI